jgi:membrane protease YdiL (CAAX protease family)
LTFEDSGEGPLRAKPPVIARGGGLDAGPAIGVPEARPVYRGPKRRRDESFGACGSRWSALAECAILLGVFWDVSIAIGVTLGILGLGHLPSWAELVMYLVVFGAMVVAVLAMILVSQRPLATIGWRSGSIALDTGLGVASAICIIGLLMVLTAFLAVFAPEFLKEMSQAQKNIEAMFPRMHPVLLVLLLGACPAFAEEIIFRGFLLTRLHAWVRSWPAVVIVGSLLFALVHVYQGFSAVVLIFLLGIVLGGLFVWRRSLLPSMVLHLLFNSVQMIMLYYTSQSWA